MTIHSFTRLPEGRPKTEDRPVATPKPPPLVLTIDTSVGSQNLGDKIIMESINDVVRELFPRSMHLSLPSHLYLGWEGRLLARKADYIFVGGTNLLSSNMSTYNQWRVNLLDSLFIDKAILVGVGWWQYQRNPGPYSRFLLRRLLDKRHLHSVRDGYSQHKLASAGIRNVINTGCASIWGINTAAVEQATYQRPDSVITTFTDYKKNITRDRVILDGLRKNYSKRYIWLQGTGDFRYVSEYLGARDFKLIDPNVESYDQMLRAGPCDYIGTRLHAGIRALQRGQYARIISVDNRAREMAGDFGIPILDAVSESGISEIANIARKVELAVPHESIARWKSQFLAH